jgi:hypothetical protein
MKREHTHEYTLWVVVMAVSLHVLEEYTLNFVGWAEVALHVNVSWEIFHLVNTALVFFGIACAMIGWRAPSLSLMMPAIIAINALFFHILLTVVQWRISPGTGTSILFFVPAATWAYYGAYRDGVLTRRAVIVSASGGLLITFYLTILLMIRLRYGRQFIFTGHG